MQPDILSPDPVSPGSAKPTVQPSNSSQLTPARSSDIVKHAHRFIFGYLALALLVAAAAGVYEWQHKKVDNLNGQVTTLHQQVVAAQSQLKAAKANETTLQTEVTKDTQSSSSATLSTGGTATCSTAELSASMTLGGGAAGNDFISVIFTNKSTQSCTLNGYPIIQMQNSSHSVVAIPSSHGGGMLLKDPGASLITVKPNGTAVTGLSINEGGQTCYDPAYIQVTLPGSTSSYTLNAATLHTASSYLLCSSYTVTAMQSGSQPASAN